MERIFVCAFINKHGMSVVFIILVLDIAKLLTITRKTSSGLSLDLAFHTAISFVTDTNLQHYAGDQQLSNCHK